MGVTCVQIILAVRFVGIVETFLVLAQLWVTLSIDKFKWLISIIKFVIVCLYYMFAWGFYVYVNVKCIGKRYEWLYLWIFSG